MLNKTAEKKTSVSQQEPWISPQIMTSMWSCDHVICFKTHTSQFLPPDALTLLLHHVQRRGPEMGHDHQELLEADRLDRTLTILMEVPKNNRANSDILSLLLLYLCSPRVKQFRKLSNCTFCQRRPLWSASGWGCMLDQGFHWSDLSWGLSKKILRSGTCCHTIYNYKLRAAYRQKPVKQVSWWSLSLRESNLL